MTSEALDQELCEDCISRDEVLTEINGLGRNAFKCDSDYDSLFAFIDSLPSVRPKAEQEPKTDILDKIREEIESLSNANPSNWHTCDVVEREGVLEIIDKYRQDGNERGSCRGA